MSQTINLTINVSEADPIVINVPSSFKVVGVKELVRRVLGLGREYQRLSFGAKVMMDSSTMEDYNLRDGDQLWVTCQMAGCSNQCLTGLHGAHQGTDPEDMYLDEAFEDYYQIIRSELFPSGPNGEQPAHAGLVAAAIAAEEGSDSNSQ
ncbi:hypothetical protein B0O80DRAFT_484865 [Mortierella sp. GBAus27b]|nr:hypothetical protein BGX31_009581 [Mortierella sp. GBA43]KAI8358785.1 hypothetical protein B0O80DRAFT_484865 [Mortierella sp. GBAus27b]